MMNKPLSIGVLGGGSWGTALVKIFSENQSKIGWCIRNEEIVKHLSKHGNNPHYLSSVTFKHEILNLTSNINTLIAECDIIILAVPSPFLHQSLNQITAPVRNKIFFSAVKGIVPETKKIVGEYLNESFNVPFDNIGVITGPCHAEEVALERLSYLTVACRDAIKAEFLADQLRCTYINCKVSDDIIGTEYAATLKNIYAIAVGIAHGLGYGDNFQSVLMSNAIREMKRFISKVHKMKRNINNSAYLGDLLVTGYSVFSRNRMLGNMVGKGYTVKSAIMEMTMVSEGYYATKTAYELGQHFNGEFPVIDAVYDILYREKSAKKIMRKLTQNLD